MPPAPLAVQIVPAELPAVVAPLAAPPSPVSPTPAPRPAEKKRPSPKPRTESRTEVKPGPQPREIQESPVKTPETAHETSPPLPDTPSPVASAAPPTAPPAPATPRTPAAKTTASDAAYAASNRKPPYPRLSRANNEQGTVVLRVMVRADGTAGTVEIKTSSGYPLLDNSARNTVHTWRFNPATVNGKPVDEWYEVSIPFKLVED